MLQSIVLQKYPPTLHGLSMFSIFYLQDIFNSVFAGVYFFVLSTMAITRYTVAGKLAGGVRKI